MKSEWGSTADTVATERADNMAKRLADDTYSCPSCRELIVDIDINGKPVAFDVAPELVEVVGLASDGKPYLLPAGYSRPKHKCPSIKELEQRMRAARVPFMARFRELLHLGADAATIQADPLSLAYCAANDRWRAARLNCSLEELEERDRRNAPLGYVKTRHKSRYGMRDIEDLGDGY